MTQILPQPVLADGKEGEEEMTGKMMQQLNQFVSERCDVCKKRIQPGHIFHRLSYQPDGIDEYGKNICTNCIKNYPCTPPAGEE